MMIIHSKEFNKSEQLSIVMECNLPVKIITAKNSNVCMMPLL